MTALNKKPTKRQATKMTCFRLTDKTRYQLSRIADDMDRSCAKVVEILIEQHFKTRGLV